MAGVACYPSFVSTLDHLSDLAPERVRPLKRIEFERLVAAGVFDDERIELLGGVIVEMSPQSMRHEAAIERLNEALVLALRGRATVRPRLSIAASDDSLPEPDVSVVSPRDRNARPSTAHLVIEVADSSLRKDRRIKGRIYAAAGVPEYWIVNLVDNVIEVYTSPSAPGYAHMREARPGERLSVGAFPDVEIAVADVVG